MDKVPEKKKFFIYLFSPSLYTPIPYSMTTTMIRQNKVIDDDKMIENDQYN